VRGARKPVVTVQFPDSGAKRLRDHFHRAEAESGRAEDLHAALDAILTDPKGTLRGVVQKSPFKGRKPALRGDEDKQLKEAVKGIAAAV
jgi:hypothetical protein